MSIRAVPDREPEPLTIDDLKEQGNEIARRIRLAAFEATRYSLIPQVAAKSWARRDLRALRADARRAVESWNKVDALVSELLEQIDRAKKAEKP